MNKIFYLDYETKLKKCCVHHITKNTSFFNDMSSLKIKKKGLKITEWYNFKNHYKKLIKSHETRNIWFFIVTFK